MSAPWKLLTGRGWALFLSGVAGTIAAIAYGQRDVLWVAFVLLLLPVVGLVAVSRSGLRLKAERRVNPSRGVLGQQLTGTLSLTNKGSFPLAVLKFEESLPRELGRRARFTMHTVRGTWRRTVHYPMYGSARGRYTVGPLLVRASDPFGLARLDRRFSSTQQVLVTPRIVPLGVMATAPGSGQTGDSTPRRIGLVGQDDVLIREYRDGDDVRRIHWRSTARKGEIMVRREEQSWDPSLTLLLDSRIQAHAGTGPDSSFEWAVSAVASVARHMQRADYTLRIIDAAGLLIDTSGLDPASAEDGVVLALTDAALTPGDPDLQLATDVVNAGRAGEMLIAVMGRLTRRDVQAMNSMRQSRSQGLAMVLDVDAYVARRFRATPEQMDEHEECVAALAAANWRVVPVRPPMDVDQAWHQLDQIGASL
ncbi:DUF58 domain-containing protein [Propionibacteriaceae bacterium G1746]